MELSLVRPDARFYRQAGAHSCNEIILVTRGTYEATVVRSALPAGSRLPEDVKGERWAAGPGEIIYYPAGTVHTPDVRHDGSAAFFVLQWHGGKLPKEPLRTADANGRLIVAMRWMHDILPATSPETARALDSLLTLVLYELEALLNGESPSRDPVERAKRFMRNNLKHPLTLALIAETVGMSRFRFARLFKERTGVSPMKYLRDLRLSAAANLLTECDATFEGVAARVGYGSAEHLSRLLRRRCDVPPAKRG